MNTPECDRLVAELDALPEYRGWKFTFEYPGYFCYSHPANPFSVFFTPDWEGDESLPIEVVQVAEGLFCAEHSNRLPLPLDGRTGPQLFELVRPTLDTLLDVLSLAPRTFDLHVRLTAGELKALQEARDLHEQGWEPTEATMEAINKVIAAARDRRLSVWQSW